MTHPRTFYFVVKSRWRRRWNVREFVTKDNSYRCTKLTNGVGEPDCLVTEKTKFQSGWNYTKLALQFAGFSLRWNIIIIVIYHNHHLHSSCRFFLADSVFMLPDLFIPFGFFHLSPTFTSQVSCRPWNSFSFSLAEVIFVVININLFHILLCIYLFLVFNVGFFSCLFSGKMLLGPRNYRNLFMRKVNLKTKLLKTYRVLQTHQAESSKMEYRSTVPYSSRFGKNSYQ